MIPKTHKDLLISTRGVGKEVSFAPVLKEKAALLKRRQTGLLLPQNGY